MEISKAINMFNNHLGQYSDHIRTAKTERENFVGKFPESKLSNLTKEEYCIGSGRKDTFCYWVERGTKNFGSILGARADKFGLYISKKTSAFKTSSKFASSSPDASMSKVRDSLVDLLAYGRGHDLNGIHLNSLSSMFKGKILSLYFPEKYLNIFSENDLDYFIEELGIDLPVSRPLSVEEKRDIMQKWKMTDSTMKEKGADSWDNLTFSFFLYTRIKRDYGYILKLNFVNSGLRPDTYVDYIRQLQNGSRKKFYTTRDVMRGGIEKNGAEKLIIYDPSTSSITAEMGISSVSINRGRGLYKAGNKPRQGTVRILDDPIPLGRIEAIPGLHKFSKKGFRSTNITAAQYSALFGAYDIEEDDEEEQYSVDVAIEDMDLNEIRNFLRDYVPKKGEKIQFKGESYKRDQGIIGMLKKLRGYKCQICNTSIKRMFGPPYVEGAHIKPKSDNGSEDPSNILILCPNHHKEFDLGERIPISQDDLSKFKFKLNGNIYELSVEV